MLQDIVFLLEENARAGECLTFVPVLRGWAADSMFIRSETSWDAGLLLVPADTKQGLVLLLDKTCLSFAPAEVQTTACSKATNRQSKIPHASRFRYTADLWSVEYYSKEKLFIHSKYLHKNIRTINTV
jgi:hypothetical protein